MGGVVRAGAAIAAMALLAGCSEAQLALHGAKRVANVVAPATPSTAASPASLPTGRDGRGGGIYKVGKPYQVNGVWYYPREDPNYDETGIASWYGPGFHGNATANGEQYDQNDLTAAHQTLPMPTMVRVVNLENGRSIVVRVNDRGPFVNGRIIDLSRRAAQLLDIERRGTARVRVVALAPEGDKMIALRPETTAEEAQLVSAAPRDSVAGQALPPPEGIGAAPPPPAPRDPVVAQVPVTSTRVFIQAGAFSQPENAHRLRDTLARLGPTNVSRTTVRGQTMHRVRIGPIETVEEADGVLARGIANGFPGARIVVD